MTCLETSVAPDNPVRLIELFVERLDLKMLHFAVSKPKTEGRPSFDTRTLLKLHFYG